MTSAEPPAVPTDLASTVGEQLKTVLGNPDELASMDPASIVAMVLDGVNKAQSGDPLGTVRQDASGVVYIRVNDSGVHKWRVIDPNNGGANVFDMQQISHPVVMEPKVEGQ